MGGFNVLSPLLCPQADHQPRHKEQVFSSWRISPELDGDRVHITASIKFLTRRGPPNFPEPSAFCSGRQWGVQTDGEGSPPLLRALPPNLTTGLF